MMECNDCGHSCGDDEANEQKDLDHEGTEQPHYFCPKCHSDDINFY